MKSHSYLRWLFLASLFFNSLVSVASSPYAPGGCGYNVALYADKLLTPGTTEPGHQVQALGHYYLEHTPAHDFIGVHRITDTLVGNCLKNVTNFSGGDFGSWADHADGPLSIDGSGNGPGSYTLTPEDHNNIFLRYEPDPLATTDPRFFIYITPNQPIEQFHVTLLDVNPSQIVWIVNGSIEFSGPAEIPGLLICNGTATFSGLTTYTPALWIRDKAIFSTTSGSGPLCTTSCLKSLNRQNYDSGKTLLQTLLGRDNSVFLHADYASSYNPLTLNYRSSMHSGGSNLNPSDSLLVGSGTSVTNMDLKVDSLMTVLDSNMLRTYAISSGSGGRLNPGIYNVDGGSNLSDFHLTGDDRSIYIFLVSGTFNPDLMDYGLVKPENVFFYGKFLSVSSPTSARGVFVAGGISIYAPDIEAALYAGGGISIASTRARAYGPRGKVLNIHLAPSNSLAKLNDSTLSLCASSGPVPVSITTSFATSLRVQSLQDTTVTSDQTYALSDSASELTTVYISEAATSLRLVGLSVDDTLRKPAITIQRRPSGVLTSLFPMIGALDSVSGNFRVADTADFLLTAFADTTGLDSLVWNFSTGEKRVTASSTLNHPPLLWMQTIMAQVQAYRDGCPSVMRSIGYSGGYPEPVDQPQVGLQIRFDPVRIWGRESNNAKLVEPKSYDSSKPGTFRNYIWNRLPDQLTSLKYSGFEFIPYEKMGNLGRQIDNYSVGVINYQEEALRDHVGNGPPQTINTSLFLHDDCQSDSVVLSCGGTTIRKAKSSLKFSQYWQRTDHDCWVRPDANFYNRYIYPSPLSGYTHGLEYTTKNSNNWSTNNSFTRLEWSQFTGEDINSASSSAFSKLKLKFRVSYKGDTMRVPRNACLQLTRLNLDPKGLKGVAPTDAVGASPHNRYHIARFVNPNNSNEQLVVVLIKKRGDRGFFGLISDKGTLGDLNSTTDIGTAHDKALKNSYPLVYSWSGLEARDLPRITCDFTQVGDLMVLERELEVRIFTSPISEQSYQEKLSVVLQDVLEEEKEDNPFVNDFFFRGPIGSVFIADKPNYSSSRERARNPNRYIGADSLYLDYQSNRVLDTVALASMCNSVVGRINESCMNLASLRGSGLIVWDLDGQQTPHTSSETSAGTTYTGNLEAMLSGSKSTAICAEMLWQAPGHERIRIIDLIFRTIRNYGLIPGVTIRPQKLHYDISEDPYSSCQRQEPFVIHKYMNEDSVASINDSIALLIARKMFYAYATKYTYDSSGITKEATWGARIFYIDSPYTWDLLNGKYRYRKAFEPVVYYKAREYFKAMCVAGNVSYLPIAIIPETTEGANPQDFGMLASTIPYVKYFKAVEAGKLIPDEPQYTTINTLGKGAYPTSAFFVNFKPEADLMNTANLFARTNLINEINTYFKNELLTCNHISSFRGWITNEEQSILKSAMYDTTSQFAKSGLGGCFMSEPISASLADNSTLIYDCKPRVILDNGGYNNYNDPSSDSLRISVARTGKRAKLDLISGRLDIRPAGVIHDSLSIRQRGGSPVSLERAMGTSFQQSIESNTNLPITMRMYASDGIADAGFMYKLSCRNLNDPIIRAIDKTVAFESCTLKVSGYNLDSCTFGLNLHTFRAPDSVAADGTWAKFVLPRYNTYSTRDSVSTSIFDGSFVFARSLRSGLIVRSPEKLLIRRGRIRINAPNRSLCEPKRLRVDTTEKLLFSEADPNLSRKPYYRWYRLTHGTVSSVSRDTVRCTNCFSSDGRSNQYLLIDKVGEFRIRHRLNSSSVLLYPGDIPISGTALVGHKVSVGGNERLEGSTATITCPGTYWCYDANLGFAGSNSEISCPLIPDTIAVSESDVVECGLLFARNSRGKMTSTVETGKLNLKDSAFTFEMLLSHDGAGARWDTVSTYKWSADSSIVNLSTAMSIFVDRNGHLAVRLFNGKKIGKAYKQLITRDPLVPRNSYHVAVVRKDSDSLFFFVTPVSSLTGALPIGYSSLWVDSLPYNTSPIRIPQSQFFRARQGIRIEDSSSLNFNNHFFLQLYGQDSLTQLRGLRLWRGARSEDQIKADALQVLSGEDGGSDNMRQVFDYRFLAKAGDSILQTTPLDPDLVLRFGRSKEPSLSPSSCGMAHPSAALAGPDIYPTSSDTIHLASATLNPPSGTWEPTSAVTIAGIFSPLQGRAGDNFVRYNIPTSGTGTARAGCNTAIPLFRRIQLPGQITSPGDTGLTPYPWKLYSYQADWGSLNRDSLSFIWEAKHDSTPWAVVDSGQHSTLRYAWVFKSVLGDSLRVRIRVRSAGSVSYFTRKLGVKPRYMVEIFGLQSSDTVAATFDSLRIDSIAAQMKYPANQVHGNLPQAALDACGGGGIRACIRLRWLLNGVEQIRDVSSELVATDSGVPMRTTANNPLRPGVYAYTRIRPIPSGSLPLSLQFTFNRLLDNGYYSGYTLPLSVLVQPKVADTTHPLTIRAACVSSKAKLIADSLKAGTTLWASPGGKSYLDSTWASGVYHAYGVVNGRCRAATFGVFNGGDMATILKDTTLTGTTFVLKDVSVYEGALTLAPKARVYMVAGAFPSNVHFIKDSVKMLDLRFGDWSTLELSPGSVIQGVCNMWGSIRFYRRAFLKKFSGADKPLIADAYRGLWYTDEVAEGPVLSARTSHDSLDMIPALYVRGLRFERSRVAIDDQIGIAHFGTVDSCEFVGNKNMLPPLKNDISNTYYGFKALSIAQRDVQILVRQNHFRHYQFGVVEQGKLTSSIGEHGPDITVDTSRFDSCGFAAIYSRYSRVQVSRSIFKFGPQVGYGSSTYEKQAGDPFDPAYHTELDFYQRPIGVYIDSTNRQRLSVSSSRFEGCRDSSRFSGLTGTGISVSKSQVILSDSKLRRLKVGVRMMRIPPEGYQSVSGSHFWACQNGIYAGINGLWQNTDLELTCSSFEPGDTLPDYSGSTPHFSRQLLGSAVGIKAEARGVREIGQLVAGSDPREFSPGANIFPLAGTALNGASLHRNINPDSNDVNSRTSIWRSPSSWTSLDFFSGTIPRFHRFRNEFLGSSAPIDTVAHLSGMVVGSDAKDAGFANCLQSYDSLQFPNPTRVKRSDAVTSVQSAKWPANRLHASPNPVSDILTVSYALHDGNSSAMLELCDLTGTTVRWKKLVSSKRGIVEIDLTRLPSGVYLVRLIENGAPPSQIRIVRIQ